MTLDTDYRACGDDFDAEQDFSYGMLTCIVGINAITEHNADQFFARVNAFERLNGALRNISDGGEMTPFFYTREEIGTMVGYRTNALPLTSAQFRKHAFDVYERFEGKV